LNRGPRVWQHLAKQTLFRQPVERVEIPQADRLKEIMQSDISMVLLCELHRREVISGFRHNRVSRLFEQPRSPRRTDSGPVGNHQQSIGMHGGHRRRIGATAAILDADEGWWELWHRSSAWRTSSAYALEILCFFNTHTQRRCGADNRLQQCHSSPPTTSLHKSHAWISGCDAPRG
jgi:hypothetical protein